MPADRRQDVGAPKGRIAMPQTRHVERHFTAGETVRDIVIGMSDGLTVPFALAAGLTGAINNSGIIVTAGLAEIAAGARARGPGGPPSGPSGAAQRAEERRGARPGGAGSASERTSGRRRGVVR